MTDTVENAVTILYICTLIVALCIGYVNLMRFAKKTVFMRWLNFVLKTTENSPTRIFILNFFSGRTRGKETWPTGHRGGETELKGRRGGICVSPKFIGRYNASICFDVLHPIKLSISTKTVDRWTICCR